MGLWGPDLPAPFKVKVADDADIDDLKRDAYAISGLSCGVAFLRVFNCDVATKVAVGDALDESKLVFSVVAVVDGVRTVVLKRANLSSPSGAAAPIEASAPGGTASAVGGGARAAVESGSQLAFELRAAGVPLQDIRAGAVPLNMSELEKGGFSVKELKDSFSLASLEAASHGVQELKAAGFTATQLKAQGHTVQELRRVGFTISQLVEADVSLAELKRAGFSLAELRITGLFKLPQLQAVFTSRELREECFNAKEMKDTGCNAKVLREAGYSLIQLKAAVCGGQEWQLPEESRLFRGAVL